MQMRDAMIVSVESRKGGVGKTTAALNLARLLQRRHHAVLFLDVDITGTNAADALDSPFWKDITHLVRPAAKTSPPANLLQLFQEQFMAGKGFSRFVPNGKTLGNALTVASDRINVLGSQVYNFDSSKSNGKARILCKPSILFDDLHAFWFIEFLQGICAAFVDTCASDRSGRPVTIIIDNSPGYVGIAPAVQEWLTDLGPQRGKFLTVASLDRQDLISCGHAVHHLHALFERKWKTSRKYLQASKGREADSAITFEEDEHAFLVRLAERPGSPRAVGSVPGPSDSLAGTSLEFYRDEGRSAPVSPERYQALLINRVPRLVKRGIYHYAQGDIWTLLHRSESHVVQSLIADERGDYRQCMVSYDEYIEYQFIQSLISRRHGRQSRRQLHAEEFMERQMVRRPIPSDKPLQEFLRSRQEWSPSALDQLRQYVHALHNITLDAIGWLDQLGFSHLTRLIQDEWLPGKSFQDFRNAMRDILLESSFPYVERVLWEHDTGPVNPETLEIMNSVLQSINRYDKNLAVPRELVEQFIPSLAAVIGLSFGGPTHFPFAEEVGGLFGAIATAQAKHWSQRDQRPRSQPSLQRFLASDMLTKQDVDELRRRLPVYPRWLEEGSICRLYRACASAQARILDVRQDTEFLLDLLRRLVHEEVREAPILPYIRGVAEKVIEKKTASHEVGRTQIAKGFSSAQYMEEFSEVLERVLRRWEGKA